MTFMVLLTDSSALLLCGSVVADVALLLGLVRPRDQGQQHLTHIIQQHTTALLLLLLWVAVQIAFLSSTFHELIFSTSFFDELLSLGDLNQGKLPSL